MGEIIKTENQIDKYSVDVIQSVNRTAARELRMAINSNDATINKIKLGYGIATSIEVLMELISQIVKLSNKNADKVLNVEQAVNLANDILANYWYLKISEIKFAFMQGYKNQYPTKIFDTLEFNHFTDWLESYIEDRNEFMVQNRTKPEITNNEPSEIDLIELQKNKEKLKELREKLQRENYEFNKKLAEEKLIIFESVYNYCTHYGIESDNIYKQINESVDEYYKIPAIQNTFVDKDGKPSLNRFNGFISTAYLRRLNQYKPKTYSDVIDQLAKVFHNINVHI